MHCANCFDQKSKNVIPKDSPKCQYCKYCKKWNPIERPKQEEKHVAGSVLL
jgi:hypothetical protein